MDEFLSELEHYEDLLEEDAVTDHSTRLRLAETKLNAKFITLSQAPPPGWTDVANRYILVCKDHSTNPHLGHLVRQHLPSHLLTWHWWMGGTLAMLVLVVIVVARWP